MYTLDCSHNPNYEFKIDTCTCGCIDQEQYPGYCTEINPLWSWDDNKCTCDCTDSTAQKTCLGSDKLNPKKWNPTSCNCVCKTTQVCDLLIQRYNPATCACDCIASPPAAGCPKGFSWSKSQCKCTQCTHCITPP